MSAKIKTTLISGRGLPLLFLLQIGIGIILITLFVSVPGASCDSDADGTTDIKASNISTLDRLQMNLFINYDVHTQPTAQGKPTNVTLGLSVNYIDIDEMNGKMTLHCWLNIRWKDELRSWNFLDYDNITKVHLPVRNVWRPDITLFNAAGENGDYLVDTQVILSNDGSFHWVPAAVYTAYCKLNMRNWPYDQQTCKLKIGTWSHNNIQAEFSNRKQQALDYSELVQSTEWEIINGQTQFIRQDYYSYIEFSFTAGRRSSMYTAVIYTPASCIVILALSAFWLPPQMGEKILLNGILIVLIAAFLMYFAQILPVLANNTPLIVVFYSASLLLLSISTIIEVVVLYLSTAQHKRRLPDFLKRLLNGKMGTWLLLSHFSNEQESQSRQGNGIIKELDEHIYDNADDLSSPLDINPNEMPSARALQYDWILLAIAVDRISFAAFSLVYIILAIIYII